MFRQEKMIEEFGEEAASAKSRLQRQRELDAERASLESGRGLSEVGSWESRPTGEYGSAAELLNVSNCGCIVRNRPESQL